MPRHPSVYGNMLRELIAKHGVDLLAPEHRLDRRQVRRGSRMPIKATRALLDAALAGQLASQPMRTDPLFGFQVPLALPGVDPESSTRARPGPTRPPTTPRRAQLVDMFRANFAKFEVHVDADVLAAAPILKQAAE